MGIHAFVFRWRRILKLVCNTHFHQHVSMLCSKKADAQLRILVTASLVLYRRTLPNGHIQVLRAEQLLIGSNLIVYKMFC